MSQPTKHQATILNRDDVIVERFQRYARGRIAHFGKRQILTVVGSCFVALLTTPFFGLLALAIALCGELLDCFDLKWQLSALDQGKKYKAVNIAAMATAAFQALSTSICILLADLLPQGGAGVNFALVFLMSAALNAGLVWPYHKPSSLIRLALYSLTFSVIIIDQLGDQTGS